MKGGRGGVHKGKTKDNTSGGSSHYLPRGEKKKKSHAFFAEVSEKEDMIRQVRGVLQPKRNICVQNTQIYDSK